MNFFFRFYFFLARRPKRVLQVIAALTALLLVLLAALASLRTNAFDFIDQKYLAGLSEIREKFGERPMMSVTLEDGTGDGVLSLGSLREQDRIFTAIESRWPVRVEGITQIMNFHIPRGSVRDITEQDAANAIIVDLYQEDPYEFERIARKAISDPDFINKLQEANIFAHMSGIPLGTVSLRMPKVEATRVVITPSPELSEDAIRKTFAEINAFIRKNAETFTPRAYAVELMNSDIDERVRRNSPVVVLALSALLSVVLMATFRHRFFVAVPLLILGLTLVWTFGLGAMLGIRRFAFNHILVIPLLLGQCIDNLIHFNERFREEQGKAGTKEEALKTVFKTAGQAALLTTAINMTAFTADIFTTSLRPIIEYALLIVFGLGLALILTYAVNTAALLLYPFSGAKGGKTLNQPDDGSEMARRLFSRLLKNKKLIFAGGAGIILLAGINTFRIDRNFEVATFLPEHSPTRAAYEYERDTFGLYNPHYALISGNAASTTVFQAIGRVEATLKTFPEVEKIHGRVNAESLTYLYSKLIPETIPERPADAYAAFFKNDAIINRLTGETVKELSSRLIANSDNSYPATLVKFWPVQSDSAAIKRLGDEIDGAEPPGGHYKVSAAGDFLAFSRTMDDILVSAAKATLLTLFIIILILSILHRSLITGLIMVVPVAFGTAVGFGILPVLKVELNAMNGTIGVLAVGLGVDYAIQLMTRYREERKSHARPAEAMSAAFARIALPLAGCALLTVAGLIALIGLLPITAKFGIASAMALLSSYIASVTILPLLIVAFDERKTSFT